MISEKSINVRHIPGNARNNRKAAFKKYLRDNWQLYTLLLPAIIFVFVFAYIPMYGVQIAFRNYKVSTGILGSQWAGLKYFIRFFKSSNFWPLLGNTLGISAYSLVAGFPIPIILALMLNELKQKKLRKTIQMITYAPHFISTVAICGMIHIFTNVDTGLINNIIRIFGGEGIMFMTQPRYFKTIYVISGIWQSSGWRTVIYMAALSSVDPQIVEASIIDGANRFQKILHVDIPSILPTIITLFILNCGSLLSVGYEKILLLQNQLNMEASDVISTYVYRLGILDSQYSYTTAIGLFDSVVNFIILFIANNVMRKVSDTSLW